MSNLEASPQLAAALELARYGCWVFPLKPLSKKPAHDGWPAEATRDPDAINKLWGKRDFNVGIATAKFGDGQALLVVDVDVKNGKDGNLTIQQHERAGNEFPPTMTSATPTGGRHLAYVVDTSVKQGVDVLGSGLDVRSHGGYIVGPGSVTAEGTYVLQTAAAHVTIADYTPADAPAWLIAACGKPRTKSADRTPLAGVDPARALKRGREYLANAPEAVSGAGGNTQTYTVATKLLALGMTPEAATNLLLDEYFEGCGWTATEMAEIVANAERYMQDPIGIDAPEAQFIVPHVDTDAIVDNDSKPRRYVFQSVADLLSKPPPAWRIRSLMPDRGLAVVYGAPGSGKSFAMLDMATAIVRGVPWGGQRVKRGAVVYVGLEGQMGPRVRAYVLEHAIEVEQLAGLHIIERQSLNLLHERYEDTHRLIADVRDAGVADLAAVVIDTLNRSMPGGNENAPEDMGRAIRCASEISAALDCLVVFVHHSGKDASAGARGHSSLLGAADAELRVTKQENGDARFIEATKVKDGEDGQRFGFRLKSVDLGATSAHDPDAEDHERDSSCVVEDLKPTADLGKKLGKPLTGHAAVLLAAFDEELAGQTFTGSRYKEPHCSVDEWRSRFFTKWPIDPELHGAELTKEKDKRRAAFNDGSTKLQTGKLIAIRKGKAGSEVRRVTDARG